MCLKYFFFSISYNFVADYPFRRGSSYKKFIPCVQGQIQRLSVLQQASRLVFTEAQRTKNVLKSDNNGKREITTI